MVTPSFACAMAQVIESVPDPDAASMKAKYCRTLTRSGGRS
jgi:hypothetical protein